MLDGTQYHVGINIQLFLYPQLFSQVHLPWSWWLRILRWLLSVSYSYHCLFFADAKIIHWFWITKQTLQISKHSTSKVGGTSTGTVTCQRYMTGNKWHIVSPTASGGSISMFIQDVGNAIPSWMQLQMQPVIFWRQMPLMRWTLMQVMLVFTFGIRMRWPIKYWETQALVLAI